MSITIDNPTAESFYAALKQVPPREVSRLREMLNEPDAENSEAEESAWYGASSTSAARFFDEEEKA